MEAKGWELLGGWSTVVGDITRCPTSGKWKPLTAPAAFAGASQDADLVRAAAELATIADREVISVVMKMPDSP